MPSARQPKVEREIGEIKGCVKQVCNGLGGYLEFGCTSKGGLKGRWVWEVIVVLWYGGEGEERQGPPTSHVPTFLHTR